MQPTMMIPIFALSSFVLFWGTLKDIENGRYTEYELVKNKALSEHPVKRHYTMAVWSLQEEMVQSLMKTSTGWLLMKEAGLNSVHYHAGLLQTTMDKFLKNQNNGFV